MFDGGGSNAQLFVRFAAEVIAEVIAELMAELIRLSSRSGRISRLEKAPHCKSATNPAQSIPADSAFSSAPPPSLPPSLPLPSVCLFLPFHLNVNQLGFHSKFFSELVNYRLIQSKYRTDPEPIPNRSRTDFRIAWEIPNLPGLGLEAWNMSHAEPVWNRNGSAVKPLWNRNPFTLTLQHTNPSDIHF